MIDKSFLLLILAGVFSSVCYGMHESLDSELLVVAPLSLTGAPQDQSLISITSNSTATQEMGQSAGVGPSSEVLDNFERSLGAQVSDEGPFSVFVRALHSHHGAPWREVIGFLDMHGRSLINLDGEVDHRRITLDDFQRAGVPYFLSYDEWGRPFIAVAYTSSFPQADPSGAWPRDCSIKVYYLRVFPCLHWDISSAGCLDIPAEVKESDFLSLAKLINQGLVKNEYSPDAYYHLASMQEVSDQLKKGQEKQA